MIRRANARITTDRLELAPLGARDAPEMVGVLADPSLYTFTGGAAPTLAELHDRFARWVKGSSRDGEQWHNWVIRLRDGGAAIGHLQATIIDDGREADVAWLIGTSWQGRGYASEAARALVGWLEGLGVGTVTAHIGDAHGASGRVAAAAGLTRTDDVEDDEVVWRRQGRDRPGDAAAG